MTRVATWANQGQDVSNQTSIDEVLKAADLDYEVIKKQLQYRVGDKWFKAANRMLTIRKDKPDVQFGSVSEGYQVLQNGPAFDFINHITDKIEFVRAGQTRGGLVYVISRLPEVQVLGDAFQPYLIFQTGHNGFISLKANICMLRMVCQNQFSAAFKNAANAIKIRHCGDITGKLEMARETLQNTYEYVKNYQDFAEQFAGKKISDTILQTIIREMITRGTNPEDLDKTTDPRGTLQDRVTCFEQAYNAEDNQNFKGTAWGVMNAWTDYTTHLPSAKVSDTYIENRFIENTFNSRKTAQVINILEGIA